MAKKQGGTEKSKSAGGGQTKHHHGNKNRKQQKKPSGGIHKAPKHKPKGKTKALGDKNKPKDAMKAIRVAIQENDVAELVSLLKLEAPSSSKGTASVAIIPAHMAGNAVRLLLQSGQIGSAHALIDRRYRFLGSLRKSEDPVPLADVFKGLEVLNQLPHPPKIEEVLEFAATLAPQHANPVSMPDPGSRRGNQYTFPGSWFTRNLQLILLEWQAEAESRAASREASGLGALTSNGTVALAHKDPFGFRSGRVASMRQISTG